MELRTNILKNKIRVFKNINDITIKGNDSNIVFVTGISGSGKSYLSKKMASENNAKIFQPEWLIHYKHTSDEFKPFLDEFISKHNIKEYVIRKWDNEKSEDENILLKKYINLLLKDFIDSCNRKDLYIVEGLQLFTLIDYELIKGYKVVIKGTSSINSLKINMSTLFFFYYGTFVCL